MLPSTLFNRYFLIALVVLMWFGSHRAAAAPWDDGGTSSWLGWKMPELKMPQLPKPSLSWPSLPKPKEPAFVKATRNGLGKAWNTTKRSTKAAWDKTVYALRPYDNSPPKRKRSSSSRADQDTGFWAGLFSSPPERDNTASVNDFLRQPMPF